MLQQVEMQVVQGLTGLLFLGVLAGIGYLAPRAKAFISAHTTAKTAELANTVIDGLSTIARTVVTDFNQRVVHDAKVAGTFTPTLAASVKADAVQAVKDQGASLLSLGKGVIGNVDGLVSALIESEVANARPLKITSGVATFGTDTAGTSDVTSPDLAQAPLQPVTDPATQTA